MDKERRWDTPTKDELSRGIVAVLEIWHDDGGENFGWSRICFDTYGLCSYLNNQAKIAKDRG